MTQPLVSVAIATYNGARYVEEQLDTIYAQTWPNFEVVVSDDASGDATVAILERYARSRGLQYQVNPRRLGLLRNFECALRMCRGDYIALADQDDLWKPIKLERLVAAMDDVALAYCNVAETLETNGSVHYNLTHEPIIAFQREHGSGRPLSYLMAENWIVSHSLMVRREVVDAALPIPDAAGVHDGWLAVVACCLGNIRFLDECLQVYRRHPESVTYRLGGGGSRRRFGELVSGAMAIDWRRQCVTETARLLSAKSLPGLSAADRRLLDRLLGYYRAGLEPGWRLRSAGLGLLVANLFATSRTLGRKMLIPLRPLVAGRD